MPTTPSPASLAGHPVLADPDVQAALAIAGEPGDARIVGGAVRDMVVGRPIGDIDIATRELPHRVMTRAKKAGRRAVPTGIDHGTVSVLIGNRSFEVTTLRRDVTTDGRRAAVAFSTDFAEDARRRDFTINALSLTPDGTVHDYWNGLQDLTERRVRFIGEPAARIREDYLRILRFFRFHAVLGSGEPDASGLAACAALKDGLATLSRERIRQELLKLLVAPGAVAAVRSMDAIGLWPFILRGTIDIGRLQTLRAIEAQTGTPPDALRALAAFSTDTALKAALRLSNGEATRIAAIRKAADFPALKRAGLSGVTDDGGLREALYRLGADSYRDGVLLTAAANGSDRSAEAIAAALDLPRRWSPPRFPIDGAALAAEGVRPGPGMGRMLADAEAAWIRAGFPVDAQAVARLIATVVAASDRVP